MSCVGHVNVLRYCYPLPHSIKPMAEKMNKLLCGGYSCQFVDWGHSEVKTDCSICSLTLREPYQVDCCGSRFCKACLDPLLLTTKLCPSCKGHFSNAKLDSSLQAMLNKKLVYCMYKSKGCLWTGELQMLENHEESCNKKSIKCEFGKEFQGTNKEIKQQKKSSSARSIILSPCPKGCGSKIMPKNIDTHVREKCPVTAVQCKYCKDFQAPRKEMKKHEKSCHLQLQPNPTPKSPEVKLLRVSCAICHLWLVPGEINTHISNHCPRTVVSCEHCKSFQAPRSKMNNHLRSCSALTPKPKARLSPCPNGCGVQLKPKNVERHIHDLCPYRSIIVVCKHCKKFKAHPKKIKSHEESCPSNNIKACPNGCGMKMHTSKIKAHTDNECSLTIVSCEFAYTGCKTEKRRCEMKKHIKKEHPLLASMTRKVKQLEVEVEKLKMDNEHLTRLCSDINRLQMENKRLRSQNVNLMRDIDTLKSEIAEKHTHVTIIFPKRLQKRLLDPNCHYDV